MPKGFPKNGVNKGWLKKGENLGNTNGFKKGQTAWNKGKKTGYAPWQGKKRSEEDKEKFRQAKLGKKLSMEHRRKLGDAKRGEKAWNWKGGISPEREKQRHTFEMRLWRKAVFERDSFTCQKYKTRGGWLHAHHVLNFSDFPELRTAIDNGITLSDKAHKEFHKKYGIKNNTREQLNEFLQ